MPHGDKVSRRKEQAIAALLANSTVQSAAAAIGVNVRTLCEWLKQPAFKRAYAQAREEILERTVVQLLSVTAKAVATLERNLNCEEPGPEIRAAVAILDHALKGSEVLDLGRRVQDLENRLMPTNNENPP